MSTTDERMADERGAMLVRMYNEKQKEVWFFGPEAITLQPYQGLLEDPQLLKYRLNQLCPVPLPSNMDATLSQPKKRKNTKQVMKLMHSGVRWKAQFGFVIYCYPPRGRADRDEKSPMHSKQRGKNSGGQPAPGRPERTAFAPFTFSIIDEAVDFFKANLTVELVTEEYSFQCTERGKSTTSLLFYTRTGSSRAEVLQESFPDAAAFLKARQCAQILCITALPAVTEDGRKKALPLVFRFSSVASPADAKKKRQVKIKVEDGKVAATLDGGSALVEYTRVEERHILHLSGTDVELHLVKVEQYGATVPQENCGVRVELIRQKKGGGSDDPEQAWEAFVELTQKIHEMLRGCEAPKPELSINKKSSRQCNGESMTVPCPQPLCKFRHRYTVCERDIRGSCSLPECLYWHGRSEVQSQLNAAPTDLSLLLLNFPDHLKNTKISALLRAGLSLQLRRVQEALYNARIQSTSNIVTAAGSAKTVDELRLLVRQYNAVVGSIDRGDWGDSPFLRRCARRLRNPLPLLSLRGDVQAFCYNSERHVLLIHASTGSGKSTQLPQYLAECARRTATEEGRKKRSHKGRLVICVQPRALAAISLARFVATDYDGTEGDAKPGKAAVPHVQCVTDVAELAIASSTHIVYTTPQALLRLLRSGTVDLDLDVYAIMLDEVHERSELIDLLLATLRRQQAKAPEPTFRLVICSATLQLEAFTSYVPDAQCISVTERVHDIEVVYSDQCNTTRGSAGFVRDTVEAVKSIVNDPPTMLGRDRAILRPSRHILAFLPASSDVEAARDLLCDYIRSVERPRNEGRARDFEAEDRAQWEDVQVRILTELQPVDEQLEACTVVREQRRVVIFATPVAESSITIDGVGYVVDSGLERVSRYNAERKCSEQALGPTTKSSAMQRAGRAGRTGPGLCYRLYPESAFDGFAEHAAPAVRTGPLRATLLLLAQRGDAVADVPWMDTPDPAIVRATVDELRYHGALEGGEEGEVAAWADTSVLRLAPLGDFLLHLDSVTVPLGSLLYAAGRDTHSTEFVAVAAMAVAVSQSYHYLFRAPTWEERRELRLRLIDYCAQHSIAEWGELLCGVHLVVTALNAPEAVEAEPPRDTVWEAMRGFLRDDVLRGIKERQGVYFTLAAALAQQRTSGESPVRDALPVVLRVDAVRRCATELRRLLATCLALQVAVRRGEGDTRFITVDPTRCECRLASSLPRKQQHSGVAERARDAPTALETLDLCVYGSLFFYGAEQPGVLSLCTPVELAWLPEEVRERVGCAQAAVPSTRRIDLPTLLLQRWPPREVERWLSSALEGRFSGSVGVDSAAQQLLLYCSDDEASAAVAVLTAAVAHARERYGQSCYEVPLDGLCRLAWGAGCATAEVLRGRAEFSTLRFSGPRGEGLHNLDLDLSRMVEGWTREWFGTPQLVTVRGGVGGASAAGGTWAAFVTFPTSRSARSFYERFNALDGPARRPVAAVEPYYTTAVLAPPTDSAQPLFHIDLRFVTSRDDPEAPREGDTVPFAALLEDIARFRENVCAAMPIGATVTRQEYDQSHGILHMRVCAADKNVAQKALEELRGIRLGTIHFRSLFIDAFYMVEFPLPTVATRKMQQYMEEQVLNQPFPDGAAVRDQPKCSQLYASGNRSMLVRCASAQVLEGVKHLLHQLTTPKVLQMPGDNPTVRANAARAFSFSVHNIERAINDACGLGSRSVHPCQFQLRDEDSALCFFGYQDSYERIQDFVGTADEHYETRCTTLALPRNADTAGEAMNALKKLVRACPNSQSRTRVRRDGGCVVLFAPGDVVRQAVSGAEFSPLWPSIDGAVNTHYAGPPPEAATLHEGGDGSGRLVCEQCGEQAEEDAIRLLCGHRFCQPCLVALVEGGRRGNWTQPCCCWRCRNPLCPDEMELFASRATMRKMAAAQRSGLLAVGQGDSRTAFHRCPNQRCLGLRKGSDGVMCECSGCGLAYCVTCAAVGEVRPWHDGEHRTALDHCVRLLLRELPLRAACADCGENVSVSKTTPTAACLRGHRCCPYCLRIPGGASDAHAADCRRGDAWGESKVDVGLFYACRAEHLAASLRALLLEHPGGSPELLGKLCDAVRTHMPQEWPANAVDAVEKGLETHKWPEDALQQTIIQLYDSAATSTQPDTATAEAARDTAASAAATFLAEQEKCSGFELPRARISGFDEGQLMEAVKGLRSASQLDLGASVPRAVNVAEGGDGAALLLYAFPDGGGSAEALLRAYGAAARQMEGVSGFLTILLYGLERFHTVGSIRAARRTRLESSQLGAYTVGMYVVWEAPTCCDVPSREASEKPLADGEVLFDVECAAFTEVRACDGTGRRRVVLPAGARLVVTEVGKNSIRLRQDWDHS